MTKGSPPLDIRNAHAQYAEQSAAKVFCRVLRCVSGCCSVLWCVVVCCSVLQWHDLTEQSVMRGRGREREGEIERDGNVDGERGRERER